MTKPDQSTNGGDMMMVSEAARVLGVCTQTVRVWSDGGELPCQRTQSGFRVYDANAVHEFKAAREARSK
jgi:DNA-binding transcriptional MerR regulator